MIRSIIKYGSIPLMMLFVVTLTSCMDNSTNSTKPAENLLETAKNVTQGQGGDRVLTNFVKLLEDTNLDSTVANKNRITAIIPIDSAFTDDAEVKLSSLQSGEVNDAIRYHLVGGIINVNAIQSDEKIESMQGDDLYFSTVSDVQGKKLYINGGRLIGRINAGNGVIYAVDKVLFQDKNLEVPGLIEKRPQLKMLSEAINDANLDDTLSDTKKEFTVFAPTDKAIENTIDSEELSDNKLKYHVIPEKFFNRDLKSKTYTTINGKELSVEIEGSKVIINGNATIKTSDIEATNGVVHTIDTALELPSK